MKKKIKNLIKKLKKWKDEEEKDKIMLKIQVLATSGLVFIHGANNMTILVLLFSTVPKIAKYGIILFLIISNITVYFILKKFGRVWFK